MIRAFFGFLSARQATSFTYGLCKERNLDWSMHTCTECESAREEEKIYNARVSIAHSRLFQHLKVSNEKSPIGHFDHLRYHATATKFYNSKLLLRLLLKFLQFKLELCNWYC